MSAASRATAAGGLAPGRLVIAPAGGDTATPRSLRKRLAWIAEAVPLAGARFVDCGCGAGEYVAAFSQAGASALGVEIEAAKLARDRAGRGRPRLSRGDIQQLPLPSESFDLALVNEVLEHVPDDAAALRQVHRVLRPGGHVVIFSPNRLYPFETHGVDAKRSGRRLSPATPLVPWIPVAIGRRFVHYWARNYWPWELRRLVRDAGFEIVRTGYLWQTFENISGRQPAWMKPLVGALRALAALLERVPGLRAFGVSQIVLARRPVDG